MAALNAVPMQPASGTTVASMAGGAVVNGGRFDFDDGGTYCGGWEEGKAHGHGVCTGPKGQGEYAGSWHYGFEVSGVYTWPSGSFYEGHWQNGKRHGLGVESRGKWLYRGEWTQGFKGRYGVRQSTTTLAKYEGTWANGLQDGYGSETYADGGTFQGQWLRGMRHGYGVRTSAAFGVASHSRMGGEEARGRRPSISSLQASGMEDTKVVISNGTRSHSEDARGGFVLKSRSDETPVRRRSLVERTGMKNLMQGLRMRKQRSTGDLDRKGVMTNLRSTGSTASWISSESNYAGASLMSEGSMASFVVEDEALDANVTETYLGEWKNDKRCGFGVSERSDGLKYEGEWYTNRKYGYGVTTFKDGTREEGKYKNNILITSNKKKHLFLIRSAKFRERIDSAVNAAQRASKIALQKSDIAISRTATARGKAEQADYGAACANEDAHEARHCAQQLAPDFSSAQQVIGGQEDVLSAGSTPAKPPATMTNNYNTKLELPSQLPGLSATGGTGPPPTSLGGQLNAGVGGPGPPSPRGLTAMANPLNPASPRPITPGASNQQQMNWPAPGTSPTNMPAAPPNTAAYGSTLTPLEKPGMAAPMGNHVGGMANNKANNVMMNKPSYPASPTSPNAPANPLSSNPPASQPPQTSMQLRPPPPGHVRGGQSQSPSGRNGGPASPMPAAASDQPDYSTRPNNNNHSDIQAAPSTASMISPPVPRLDSTDPNNAYPDPAVLRQPNTLQMSDQGLNNRGRSSSRQERSSRMGGGPSADFGGASSSIGGGMGGPQQLQQQQQQQQPGFNFQKIMDDRFEHYKRPPSRERSSDRYGGLGSRQGSRQQLMSRDPSRDRVNTNATRPMSRQRTPMNNTNTEIINNNSSSENGKGVLDSLGLEAPRNNGRPPSAAGGLADLRLPAEDALKFRGVQQEIPHFGAPPKRTESLYMKPGEQQEPQYKAVGNSASARKKSLPDVQALPALTTKTGSQAMTREEISVLSSARREQIRAQLEEAERYRANPILYIFNPQIREWFSRQQLMLAVMVLNISLAIIFFKLLT